MDRSLVPTGWAVDAAARPLIVIINFTFVHIDAWAVALGCAVCALCGCWRISWRGCPSRASRGLPRAAGEGLSPACQTPDPPSPMRPGEETLVPLLPQAPGLRPPRQEAARHRRLAPSALLSGGRLEGTSGAPPGAYS